MAARTLMIQGTASHVGKSALTAALCRLYQRRGLRVAPFKAQNMSNNSFVTPDGKEIGRAQAVQAAACRVAPRADFNPVLIKPAEETTAQLVVNGEVAGVLCASDFGRIRREYWSDVQAAFNRLSAEFDLIVLEGAGSPAEINLRDCDVVNMRMAQYAGAPVVLVGDIDRGGVFASLVGTWTLLAKEERAYLKAYVINKFRGAAGWLGGGLNRVTQDTGMPCAGTLPFYDEMKLPEEDSLGWDDRQGRSSCRGDRVFIGIVDVPAISNFTDFDPLMAEPDVEVVRLKEPTTRLFDALIFPGTKHTVQALRFVRDRGFDRLAHQVIQNGGLVAGICGGYQLLGRTIKDPDGIESECREVNGLGLLSVETTFEAPKIVRQVSGRHLESGEVISGYHVRMGRTSGQQVLRRVVEVRDPNSLRDISDDTWTEEGRVFGTYLHGLFDEGGFRRWWLNRLRVGRGYDVLPPSLTETLDVRLDRWADYVERHLSITMIDRMIEQGI